MAKVPKYNAVQRAVLANRNSLIMRERSLDAEVERLLKPLAAEWERAIRGTLHRRTRDLTPTQIAEALRRTGVMVQLRAVSDQYAKSVERAVGQVVRETFRSEAYRASHAASLGPEPVRLGVGFGGLNRGAVAAAARSPILTAKVARDLSGFSAATVTGLRRDLTRAVADGWNLSDLVEKWSSGAGAGRAISQVRSIARTAMMAASNQGQVFQWRQEGLYQQLRWEATFDARTCPACGARHGKVYDINNLPPLPFHYGCRCVWLPVFATDSERALRSLSPYKGAGPGAAAGRARSYEAWLGKQPAGVQMDVLGSELKYQVWRDGDLTLAQLTNPDATTLTDAQVRRALGRAASAPAAPAGSTSLPAEVRGRTNKDLAESFSGPKEPGAYDGPTIGQDIRARMARAVRSETKIAAGKRDEIEGQMNAVAEEMDRALARITEKRRTGVPVGEDEGLMERLGDKLDKLLGERDIAAGGVPQSLQHKFHDLVRLPGRGRGLQIETTFTGNPGVTEFQLKAIQGRVNTTTDLISKRVADRPFYVNETTPKSFFEADTRKKDQAKGLVNVVIEPGNYRANYDYRDRTMRLSADDQYRVIAHELGHHLEASSVRVRDAAVKYLERRTRGEAARKMTELHPGMPYEEHEYARPDKFIGPYWGKDYRRHSTEIVSMGLEYIIEEPWVLARRDPETFDFIMAVIRGDYAEMERIAAGLAAPG